MTESDKRLDQVYFYWMERTIKAQRKATNKLFKDLGIKLTSEQWAILKRLDEEEGSTQRALAASTYKDPASLTRSLDLLEKQKLIERRSADRRSFTIHLTKEGKNVVDRVIPEAIKYREQGIKGVSAADMKTFKKVLDTIYKNFQET